MNLENAFELNTPDGDVARIAKDGNVMWQRAVAKDSTKGVSSTFSNTRMAKNLTDESQYILNKSIGETGEESASSISKISDYIPVSQGDVTFSGLLTSVPSGTSGSNYFRVHGYDANKTWVKQITMVPISVSQNRQDITVTVDPGIAYVRYSIWLTWEDIMVNEGSTAEPYYPYFSPTQVLPSAKAYGKTITATPQEELWGRYVPVQPSGNYPLKTTNMLLFMPYNQWLGYSLDQVPHPGFYWDNIAGSSSINFPVEANTTYTIKHTVSECGINRIAQYNGLFPSTEERGNNYPITMAYDSGGVLDFSVTTSGTTKSLAVQFSNSYIDTVMTELIITENNTEWIAVKDIVANTYGYLNRTTNRFIAVPEMTGTEIKRIDYLESTGTEYINSGMKGNQDTKVFIDFQNTAGTGMVFGSRTGATNNAFAIWTSSSQLNSALRVGFDNTSGYTGDAPNTNRMTIELDKVCVKQNGVKVYDVPDTWTDFETPNNLLLFAYDAAGVLTYATAKIFSCNLWQDGVEVRHFLPVKIGTTGYLLDTIEWKLYANAGTGAFTCGPEIPNRLIVPYVLSGHKGEIYYENGALHADGTHSVTLDGVTKQVQDLLYSATSYKDFQTGEVWRDWAIKVFNGTEGRWIQYGGTQGLFYSTLFTGLDYELDAVPACNLFKGKGRGEAGSGTLGECWYQSSLYKRFYFYTPFDSVETFQAYLAEQYAKGTPLIVIYPLATPTTESGTADIFRLTTKGQKTITTSVDGTAVQVRYLGE